MNCYSTIKKIGRLYICTTTHLQVFETKYGQQESFITTQIKGMGARKKIILHFIPTFQPVTSTAMLLPDLWYTLKEAVPSAWIKMLPGPFMNTEWDGGCSP